MTALEQALTTERDELQRRLEAIATLLDGTNGSAPRSRPVRRSGTNSADGDRRHRGPGRTPFRATQFLELVKNSPGISISEAAEKMSMKPNYLYRLASRELERGRLRKDDAGGFHAVETAADEAASTA